MAMLLQINLKLIIFKCDELELSISGLIHSEVSSIIWAFYGQKAAATGSFSVLWIAQDL